MMQVSWLHNNGCEVVVVTSGAVAVGKLRMKQEQMLSQSVRNTLLGASDHTLRISHGGRLNGVEREVEPRACAAAGQAGLMALYETMFAQYGVSCAQVHRLSSTCTIYWNQTEGKVQSTNGNDPNEVFRNFRECYCIMLWSHCLWGDRSYTVTASN